MNPTFPESITFSRSRNVECSRNVGFLATFSKRNIFCNRPLQSRLAAARPITLSCMLAKSRCNTTARTRGERVSAQSYLIHDPNWIKFVPHRWQFPCAEWAIKWVNRIYTALHGLGGFNQPLLTANLFWFAVAGRTNRHKLPIRRE